LILTDERFLEHDAGIGHPESPARLRAILSDLERAPPADVVFERNEPGASLFAIADGSLLVEVDPNDPSRTVPIGQGSIVGEVGLISGRKAFQRPLKEGVGLLNAIQDVYLARDITVA